MGHKNNVIQFPSPIGGKKGLQETLNATLTELLQYYDEDTSSFIDDCNQACKYTGEQRARTLLSWARRQLQEFNEFAEASL